VSKRPSTSNRITWSTVCRSLRLEHDKNAFSTVRRPGCHEAAIGFAQRLRGRHAGILARQPAGPSATDYATRDLLASATCCEPQPSGKNVS
jgi:hypothetical protein